MITKPCVCIDTNILLRVITQGKPGCEIEHLRLLRSQVTSGEVIFLYPEVIALELSKGIRSLEQETNTNFEKLTTKIKHAVDPKCKDVWNELDDVKSGVLDYLELSKARKLATITENQAVVNELLSDSRVVSLPLDSDLWVRGLKRQLAGRMASANRRQVADCCLIEAFRMHLGNSPSAPLLFCSENLADFGVKVGEQPAFHYLIQEDLPNAQLFTDLSSLVSFLQEHRKVTVPPAEVVKEAVKKSKEEELKGVKYKKSLLTADLYRLRLSESMYKNMSQYADHMAATRDRIEEAERELAILSQREIELES